MDLGVYMSRLVMGHLGSGLLLMLLFYSCAPRVAVIEKTRSHNLELDHEIKEDSSIQAFIAPYKDSLQNEMGERLVKVKQVMHHKGRNSQIGHWMCDIIMEKGSRYFREAPDAAFYNPGGIRLALIDTGWLTKGRIFELVPFDNYLVRLKMDSSRIQQLCDHMAAREGWPTSEGFTYDIFREKALNVKVQGKALRSGVTYSILTNDYVANGGDNCDFLVPVERKNAGILIRTLLLEHLRKEEVVDYSPQRRVELMME